MVSVIVTDLPYLEPLVLFLKNDADLKSHFNESDFFAEPKIDPEEIEKHVKKNGRFPKYFWIFPGDTIAKQSTRAHCQSSGIHTFYATIIKPCLGNQYSFVKDSSSELRLSGEVIEVTEIRNSVKKTISKFYNSLPTQGRFGFIYWKKDEMIDLEDGLLIATSVYELEIY